MRWLILLLFMIGCSENVQNFFQTSGPTDVEGLGVIRVDVIPNATQLINGQNETFTARAFAAGNVALDVQTFIWSTSNSVVVKIEQAQGDTATVKADDPGTAILTATVGSVNGFAEIRVVPASVGE